MWGKSRCLPLVIFLESIVLEVKNKGAAKLIKEVIVVEGKDDTVAIRRAVDADTIETGARPSMRKRLKRSAWRKNEEASLSLPIQTTLGKKSGNRLRKPYRVANTLLSIEDWQWPKTVRESGSSMLHPRRFAKLWTV